MTQAQMHNDAVRKSAERDKLFSDMVRDGVMTRETLAANIARRPALWARYSHWLDKLPTTTA